MALVMTGGEHGERGDRSVGAQFFGPSWTGREHERCASRFRDHSLIFAPLTFLGIHLESVPTVSVTLLVL
jgi:hypothetical protein